LLLRFGLLKERAPSGLLLLRRRAECLAR
jgi:hypothetical protein